MITLTLVRHGETDWNFARRIQGSTDIPLNETGRAQAREAAETLRTLVVNSSEPPALFASDLVRATETAQIIANELSWPAPQLLPELRERSYGDAEGILVDDFYARYGAGGQDAVPGAETNAELQARAVGAITLLTDAVGAEPDATERHIIAVSHGGFIREVISHATQGERPLPGERLGNASAHTFRLSDDEIHLVEYVAHQN